MDKISLLALKKSGAVDVGLAVAAKEAAEAAQEAAETAQGKAEDAAEELEQTVEDVAELKTDVSSLLSQITSKAESNGAYDEMTVGSASQLLSAKGVTDKVPYLFRRSGGAGANRAKETAVVGGTIAWNQLANTTTPEVLIKTTNRTKSFVLPAGASIVSGRKYLLSVKYSDAANLDKNAFFRLIVRNSGENKTVVSINSKVNGTYSKVFSPSYSGVSTGTLAMSEGDIWLYAGLDSTDNDSATITASNFMLTDLTQALTPAVADYVYNLENATAGAGVAKLRSWGLFIKDYYSYDAGSLQSVQVAGKVARGFNQWDEEWEVGEYNINTGEKQTATGKIRAKNFIPVVSGNTYYVKSPNGLTIYYYDADKGYISYVSGTNNTTVTIPVGVHFITFGLPSAYGATYKNDICINLSDSTRNGEYEPYESHTYPLDSSLTLRGIPELDADNNLRYNGDVYRPDGTVERRFAVVDLGTLTWSKSATDNYFEAQAPSDSLNPGATGGVTNALCSAYQRTESAASIYNGTADKVFILNSLYISSNRLVCIRDSAYTDAATFKTAMSGKMLVYELATYTTETADPYQETQLLDPYGTEEFIDAAVTAATPTRDVAIPVGHETDYPENATAKLAGLPWDFSTLIASTEKGFTATKPYSVNELLIIDNQLYKVTASIANGATITPNTNVTATTLGAQITALLNA